MDLTYLDTQIAESNHHDTWTTLDKIRHTLGWTNLELADRLSLTEKKFQQLKAKKIQPNLFSVQQLIDQIGLSFEKLVTGDIDYQALKEHASGNPFYIPDRYTVAAFSRRRTSIHLLEYIEHFFGWEMKKNILNHFQIKEAVFQNPDDQINLLFLADFYDLYIKSGHSPSILPMMGSYSVVSNKNSKLGSLLGSFDGPRELHEQVFAEIVKKSFDSNHDYKLVKISDTECVIESRISQELQDELKMKIVGNKHVCSTRGGSFSSLTGYLNLPFSVITEEKCIHRGDDCCRYRIFYKKAHEENMVRKLIRSRSH